MIPTTAAGKRLLDAGVVYRSWYPVERETIAAIETEAVAVERERIRTAVRGLEPCCDDAAVILPDRRTLRAMCQCGAYVWDAVLAIINPEEDDHD